MMEDGPIPRMAEDLPLSPVPEEAPLPSESETEQSRADAGPDGGPMPISREEVDKLPPAIGAFLDALAGWDPAGVSPSEPSSNKQPKTVELDQIFTHV